MSILRLKKRTHTSLCWPLSIRGMYVPSEAGSKSANVNLERNRSECPFNQRHRRLDSQIYDWAPQSSQLDLEILRCSDLASGPDPDRFKPIRHPESVPGFTPSVRLVSSSFPIFDQRLLPPRHFRSHHRSPHHPRPRPRPRPRYLLLQCFYCQQHSRQSTQLHPCPCPYRDQCAVFFETCVSFRPPPCCLHLHHPADYHHRQRHRHRPRHPGHPRRERWKPMQLPRPSQGGTARLREDEAPRIDVRNL